MHENRETSVLAAGSSPVQEGEKPKLGMNGTEESELAVVPIKGPIEGKPEEALEGRAGAKENRGESPTDPTQSGHPVSPGLMAVRQRARERRTEKFTNLLHHVTVELLRAGYYALQRKSAAGVDGVTWQEDAPFRIGTRWLGCGSPSWKPRVPSDDDPGQDLGRSTQTAVQRWSKRSAGRAPAALGESWYPVSHQP